MLLKKLEKYVEEFKKMGFSVEMWRGEDDHHHYFVLSLTKEKKTRDDYVT